MRQILKFILLFLLFLSVVSFAEELNRENEAQKLVAKAEALVAAKKYNEAVAVYQKMEASYGDVVYSSSPETYGGLANENIKIIRCLQSRSQNKQHEQENIDKQIEVILSAVRSGDLKKLQAALPCNTRLGVPDSETDYVGPEKAANELIKAVSGPKLKIQKSKKSITLKQTGKKSAVMLDFVSKDDLLVILMESDSSE